MAEVDKQKNKIRTFRFLPLTLRIETLGGIATPLILRGTPLPVRRSKFFSTSVDDQKSVEIHVLIGESPIAKNNLQMQNFSLSGIPSAARGVPQITVTFEVDRACNVIASAIEKSSGCKVAVEFDDAQPHLTDDEINRLLQQAEVTRTEDEKLLKLLEAKNEATSIIARAEARLREHQEKDLNMEEDRNIEKILASLGLALEKDNAEKIRTDVEELKKFVYPINFGDLQNIFGGGQDMFSVFFGASKTSRMSTAKSSTQEKNIKRTTAQEPSAKEQKLQDQLATSRRTPEQFGKIFGRGEFTLDPNLCFVLMPFEEKMHPIYDDHIRNVVESEGLFCLRADNITSTNLITWDIWEKVNRARFLIADLTTKNANVFYEVGVAHALGKDVILITQTMEDVPFDLKALRCIVYSFTPRGMREMEIKLRETIKEIMKSS